MRTIYNFQSSDYILVEDLVRHHVHLYSFWIQGLFNTLKRNGDFVLNRISLHDNSEKDTGSLANSTLEVVQTKD